MSEPFIDLCDHCGSPVVYGQQFVTNRIAEAPDRRWWHQWCFDRTVSEEFTIVETVTTVRHLVRNVGCVVVVDEHGHPCNFETVEQAQEAARRLAREGRCTN